MKSAAAVQLSATEHYMLVFAFRYALGRMSTAPSIVVGELRRQWLALNEATRRQIHREIRDAIQYDAAGMDCDVGTWREVLRLPMSGEPKPLGDMVILPLCNGCGQRPVMCLCSHDDAEDEGCGSGGGNSHS